MIDINALEAGDIVRSIGGTVAEVLSPGNDGCWILVRYIESRNDVLLVGTEDLCHRNELEG